MGRCRRDRERPAGRDAVCPLLRSPRPAGTARRDHCRRRQAVGEDGSGRLRRAVQIPRRPGTRQRRVRQPGRGERDHPGAEPGPHHAQSRDPRRGTRPARPRQPTWHPNSPTGRLPGSPAACNCGSQPGWLSCRRSRTRPTRGGRPSTSSACARRLPRPRPWPGCAATSRPPATRTSRPGSGPRSTGWRMSSRAAASTKAAAYPSRAAAAGSWAGPSARTGSSTRLRQATPPGPPARSRASGRGPRAGPERDEVAEAFGAVA